MNPTSKFRETPKGVLTNMYDHMRRRHPISFSLKEFHDRFLKDNKYLRLHSEWLAKGKKKGLRPSLDRISNKGNYTIENTHMITWAENRFKQTMERRSRKGEVYQLLNGKVVAKYKSQREAVKATGLNQALVSAVLNGKRSHTGGFQFIYSNPELLK